MDKDVVGLIITLGTCFILPISLVYLNLRRKSESEKIKKEIILAALEKNADINIGELVRKMNAPDKLLKEKLLKKLQWGMLMFFLGIGMIGFGIYLDVANIGGSGDPLVPLCAGLAALAVGIAFLASYHLGKKMLAKEMEAEEENLRSQSRAIASPEDAKHNLRQANQGE